MEKGENREKSLVRQNPAKKELGSSITGDNCRGAYVTAPLNIFMLKVVDLPRMLTTLVLR